MISLTVLLVLVIALAILFDFLNGFHDAANSIATVVVAKTLTPLQAVILAGAANFIGYFTFGHAIAKMVSSGIIRMDMIAEPDIQLMLLAAALLGAVIWNIITWIFGLPTSSSHAIIGGLIGAGIAAVGPQIVIAGSISFAAGKIVTTGIIPIIAFIFLAPFLAWCAACVVTIIVFNLFRRVHYQTARVVFRYMQLCSATCYSVGHGTNDAQKMMGVIALALVCGGQTTSLEIPGWVAFTCYSAIAIGTMMGGWRIVKTMGTGITKIRAPEGFCAESAAAMVLIGTAEVGIPVSTTHVIAGSIMGVGSVEGIRSVRWNTARRIIGAWFMTIPLTAVCSAVAYYLIYILR